MVKLNRPKRGHDEGHPHFETKMIVMDIADRELGTLGNEIGLYLGTANEFQFKPMWIYGDEGEDDKQPRGYTGDVVCLFFKDKEVFDKVRDKSNLYTWHEIQDMAGYIINYEIDGIVGHGNAREKAKNQIRDRELKKIGVFVKRIESENRLERAQNTKILKEIITEFYFMTVPTVMI
jgi:hypothetical protein